MLGSASTGLFFASLGFAFGVDRATARAVAAMLMLAAGAVLLVPRLQAAFSRLATPLATGAETLAGRLPTGLGGQFAVGALLGVVCSG